MEDKKDFIKKYWFVAVLAVVLIVFIGIYAKDAIANREKTVAAKQIDGQYAVYSVDGEYVFADDFYNSLYTTNGLSSAFIQYQRAILDSAYETTDDMNTVATNYATYMYQTYGTDYVNSQLQSMGYTGGTDDLVQYYIDAQKQDLLLKDYVIAHWDEYGSKFIEENDPRVIYHILVKVADISEEAQEDGSVKYIANPTAEEQKKLDDVLEALKSETFESVATQYSDDSSSAQGGLIGCISNINGANYYPIFTETSMALEDGEVSDPVVSSAGYHIIYNAGSNTEILLADGEFMNEMIQANPVLSIKCVTDMAEEKGFEIINPELKEMVAKQLESGEQQ